MNTSSTPTFDRLASTAKTIDFNPAWSNNTGYFDHAVNGEHAPVLGFGEVRTCVSLNNRRLVLIGTARYGHKVENLVLFDRYSDRNGVIVQNWEHEAKVFLLEHFDIDMSSRISEETLAKFCRALADKIDIRGNTQNGERKKLLNPLSIV